MIGPELAFVVATFVVILGCLLGHVATLKHRETMEELERRKRMDELIHEKEQAEEDE